MRGKKDGVPFSTKTKESQLRWTQEFDKKNYDKVTLRLRKGKKEYYHEEAKKLGYEAFNAFILDAVKEKIERGV